MRSETSRPPRVVCTYSPKLRRQSYRPDRRVPTCPDLPRPVPTDRQGTSLPQRQASSRDRTCRISPSVDQIVPGSRARRVICGYLCLFVPGGAVSTTRVSGDDPDRNPDRDPLSA